MDGEHCARLSIWGAGTDLTARFKSADNTRATGNAVASASVFLAIWM